MDSIKYLLYGNNEKAKTIFIAALAERFGPQLDIDLQVVTEIPKEKSGKFRIVKNLLK